MELTILGFMGGYPTRDIGTTAYLLESKNYHLLIDVGSNAVLSLEHYLDPLDLNAVILTHYHPDHVADMGVLQHVFQLKERGDGKPKQILPIYGHTESDLHLLRTSEGVSEGVDYSEKDIMTIGPFEIRFLKTIHPVPCYALSIIDTTSGKKFVFTADSAYLESFVDFAKDADLLLADANLYRGNEKHHAHMTSKEVGELAEEAKVKELVLTHLPPEGDWERLLEEAKESAPNVRVTLAEKNRKIQI